MSGHTGGYGGNYAGRDAISGLREEEDRKATNVLLQFRRGVSGAAVSMLNDLLMSLMRATQWAWNWAWRQTCCCVVEEKSGVIQLKKEKNLKHLLSWKQFVNFSVQWIQNFWLIITSSSAWLWWRISWNAAFIVSDEYNRAFNIWKLLRCSREIPPTGGVTPIHLHSCDRNDCARVVTHV